LVFDLLNRAETIELSLQLSDRGPAAQASDPHTSSRSHLAVSDLALKLSDVLPGELDLCSVSHIQILVAHKRERVTRARGWTLDVNIIHYSILAEDASQLVVGNGHL